MSCDAMGTNRIEPINRSHGFSSAKARTHTRREEAKENVTIPASPIGGLIPIIFFREVSTFRCTTVAIAFVVNTCCNTVSCGRYLMRPCRVKEARCSINEHIGRNASHDLEAAIAPEYVVIPRQR
mmetsp:Transcript_16189/g.35182  ORF Transcript_16189/g.35182 Transcript_16189/m.35182 type:complete len:125 (-) Transcript_16189:299-673(-)